MAKLLFKIACDQTRQCLHKHYVILIKFSQLHLLWSATSIHIPIDNFVNIAWGKSPANRWWPRRKIQYCKKHIKKL